MALALAGVLVMACGGNQEERRAQEEAAQAQEAAERESGEAAEGLEQLARGLEALASGSGGGKPTGERMVSFSQAKSTPLSASGSS